MRFSGCHNLHKELHGIVRKNSGNICAAPLRWKHASPHWLIIGHACSPIADIGLSPFTVKTEKNHKFDMK